MDNREFERDGFVFYASAWQNVLDFKESNPELHKDYTGVDNTLILGNLLLLNKLKKDIIYLLNNIIQIENKEKKNKMMNLI